MRDLDYLPDYLDLAALLDLGLSEAEATAVLRGERQLHRGELADRLELYRRERRKGRP